MGSLQEDGEALSKAAREVRAAFLAALEASWIGRFVRWLNDRLEQQEAPPPCQTGSDGASRPERGQP